MLCRDWHRQSIYSSALSSLGPATLAGPIVCRCSVSSGWGLCARGRAPTGRGCSWCSVSSWRVLGGGWFTVSGGRSSIMGRRRRLPREVASGSPVPSKETTPLQSTVLFLLPLRTWPGVEAPGLGCPWVLGRRRGQGTGRDMRWLSLSPAVLFSSSAKSVSEPRSRRRKVKILPRLERGRTEVLLRPWVRLSRFWGNRARVGAQRVLPGFMVQGEH